MPPLPLVSSREVINALVRAGFTHDAGRGKGSHSVLVGTNPPVTITVPHRREVPRGTLRSIIRASGLSVAEFLAHLGR